MGKSWYIHGKLLTTFTGDTRACLYNHCWQWTSVAFCFHIGKFQILQFKLRFNIYANIASFLLIAVVIMRGKYQMYFAQSACRCMVPLVPLRELCFGTALAPERVRPGTQWCFGKDDATRGRGQSCGRIARETASAVTRCCSNLARLADPIHSLYITAARYNITYSKTTTNNGPNSIGIYFTSVATSCEERLAAYCYSPAEIHKSVFWGIYNVLLLIMLHHGVRVQKPPGDKLSPLGKIFYSQFCISSGS